MEKTSTPTYTTTLLSRAKTWKQSECPWRDEKEDMVHIFKGMVLSHPKKRKNTICSNTEGTSHDDMRGSNSERKRDIIWDYC